MLPTFISSVICSAAFTASMRDVRCDLEATRRMSGGCDSVDVCSGVRAPDGVLAPRARADRAPVHAPGQRVADGADAPAARRRQANHDARTRSRP